MRAEGSEEVLSLVFRNVNSSVGGPFIIKKGGHWLQQGWEKQGVLQGCAGLSPQEMGAESGSDLPLFARSRYVSVYIIMTAL